MKKLVGLIALLALFSCSNSGQNNNSTDNCDNKAKYGKIDICLPIIDGMKECYSLPNVKEYADRFGQEASILLAFYINDETYEQVSMINELTFDDYFRISGAKSLADAEAGQFHLNKMADMVESNYFKKHWSEIKNNVEKYFDNISFGQPVLIDSYSPHTDIRTFILLIKFQGEDFEYVMISSSNMMLIKERLIYLNYYKLYDGEESVKNLKAKNDYMVLRLMDENF